MDEHYLMTKDGNIAEPVSSDLIPFLVENNYIQHYRRLVFSDGAVHYWEAKHD